MTELVTLKGQLASVFKNTAGDNDALSAGIEFGFPILGYKGKVWSVRYRGQENKLMRDDGDGPANSVEAVIADASHVKAKIYYAEGYKEGSSEAPDCFSTNGVTPDPQGKAVQASVCATCPNNQWGSRITPAGKKGKSCQDSKRIAVVPLKDIDNAAFGGPMLLRVPAASLQALAQYADALKAMGYPFYGVGTRIAFDPNEAYPKFVFSPIRTLTEDEGRKVVELRQSSQVARVLAEETPVVAAPIEQPKPALTFEQPPQQVALQQAPKAAPVQQVATSEVRAPETAPTSPAEEDFEAKLDSLLG